MKITKQHLKQIIKEELQRMAEAESNLMAVNLFELYKGIFSINDSIQQNVYKLAPDDKQKADKVLAILKNEVHEPTKQRFNKTKDKSTDHQAIADSQIQPSVIKAQELANQIKNPSMKSQLLGLIKDNVVFNATSAYES
jgi:hypothetical protein